MNPGLFKFSYLGVKVDFHTIVAIAPENLRDSLFPYDHHDRYRNK